MAGPSLNVRYLAEIWTYSNDIYTSGSGRLWAADHVRKRFSVKGAIFELEEWEARQPRKSREEVQEHVLLFPELNGYLPSANQLGPAQNPLGDRIHHHRVDEKPLAHVLPSADRCKLATKLKKYAQVHMQKNRF